MGKYDTLENIEKTWGTVPLFMKVLTWEKLRGDWTSWRKDSLGELYLERARYLLSTDEMIEEMLSGNRDAMVSANKVARAQE